MNSSVAQQASSAACAARERVEDRSKTNESKLQKEKQTQKKEKDEKRTRGGGSLLTFSNLPVEIRNKNAAGICALPEDG